MRIDCNHLALTMLFGKNATAAVDISCCYYYYYSSHYSKVYSLEFWIHLSLSPQSFSSQNLYVQLFHMNLSHSAFSSIFEIIHTYIFTTSIFITFFKSLIRLCLLNPVREFLILWCGTIVLNFTPRNICSCSKK